MGAVGLRGELKKFAKFADSAIALCDVCIYTRTHTHTQLFFLNFFYPRGVMFTLLYETE